MPATPQTTFLVSHTGGPIVLRIQGKASYLNCAPVGHFFDRMIEEGYREFYVDFAECTGMDSTFLGLLASAALQLKEVDDEGRLVLVRLNERNLELVQNVGLHNLMIIEDTEPNVQLSNSQPIEGDSLREKAQAANSQMVLKAHEALVEIEESNKKQFQDVISFLRSQADD